MPGGGLFTRCACSCVEFFYDRRFDVVFLLSPTKVLPVNFLPSCTGTIIPLFSSSHKKRNTDSELCALTSTENASR
jgi:hypothetical protein